uniref:Uncharacterized protein n=1 Tax=Timema tahoe TaxID=61484 RepID=A0A7R9NW45_9NEOP|nr:unnamed protein product [Timema tahoe]
METHASVILVLSDERSGTERGEWVGEVITSSCSAEDVAEITTVRLLNLTTNRSGEEGGRCWRRSQAGMVVAYCGPEEAGDLQRRSFSRVEYRESEPTSAWREIGKPFRTPPHMQFTQERFEPRASRPRQSNSTRNMRVSLLSHRATISWPAGTVLTFDLATEPSVKIYLCERY